MTLFDETDRPKPPVPPYIDLRSFKFMPLDVVALHASETWGMADGWAAKACINLWTKAWHQIPAGSLPNDENLLRTWSGVPDWERCRSVALRGFEQCSDGRLYHGPLCDRVLEAWEQKEKFRKAGKARWAKDKSGRASHKRRRSDAYSDAVLGKGKEGIESPSGFSNEKPSGQWNPNDEADLFRRGQEILGKGAGGLIARLRQVKGGSIPLARAALEMSATKHNPREYIGAVIRGATQENLQSAVGWDPGI
jgi:hypothetical protein